MNAEHSGSKDAGIYRPLPSVDLPLLPEQRRAIRVRRWLLVTLLATLTIGASAVLLIDRYWPELANRFGNITAIAVLDNDAITDTSPATEGLQDKDALPSDKLATQSDHRNALLFTTQFGKSRSFHGALLNAGLDDDECAEIEGALRHTLDFRRCLPTHRLVVERNATAI